MKFDLYFLLFLCCCFFTSVVKCEDFVATVSPYELDLNSGFLTVTFDILGDPFSLVNLEYDLSRVLISNCPDICDTGIQEVYRLTNTSNSFGNSSRLSFELQQVDKESLTFHESIARDSSSTFIRIEQGFVADPAVFVPSTPWNQVSFFIPFSSYRVNVFNSNISCTNEDRLFFNITWSTPETDIVVTFKIELYIFSNYFQASNDTPIYDSIDFIWTTEGNEFQTYVELDASIELVSNYIFYNGYVIAQPDVSSDYFSGGFPLIDLDTFGDPELSFGNGIVVVSLPILPQFGLCHRVIRENDYCTDLSGTNKCIFKDVTRTTEVGISDELNFDYIRVFLSYRYDATERTLFGIGSIPDLFSDGEVLRLQSFTAKFFFFYRTFLDYSSNYASVNININFTTDISVEELSGEDYDIELAPLCANGYGPIDFNLIRITNFHIPSACPGETYYTISAGSGNISNNSLAYTRTIKSSEIDDYLTASLLQYVYNSPRISEGEEQETGFYLLSQEERETVYVRIGLFCPADDSYKVYNTTVYLPFIAPSSEESVPSGIANENSVVVTLGNHGFCFHQRDIFGYFGLIHPNETFNTIELSLDTSLSDTPSEVIQGACSYEGAADGDIRYLCNELSEDLTPILIYTGKLTIAHPNISSISFEFTVNVIPSETNILEFEFPYGIEYGDKEIPRGTNLCGDEILFTTNIPAGRSIQTSAYVTSNGAISLGGCAAGINPRMFSDETLPLPVLATYWAHHDHREFGDVYYRYISATDSELSNVSAFVRSNAQDAPHDFVAVWAIIATWVNVPPYPADRDIFFKCAQLGVGYSESCQQTNSYQTILTTDGSKSYFISEYNCELVNWDGITSRATIGFDTPEYFVNHQFSNKEGVSKIGCSDLSGDEISSNVLVYTISQDDFFDFLQEQAVLCILSLNTDRRIFGGQSTGVNFNIPCPCSLTQANLDRRFASIGHFSDLDICYENRGRSVFVRCCYSSFSSELNTDLSVYTRYSYRRGVSLYNTYDSAEFIEACSYNSILSSIFYQYRRRASCTGYLPPRFICIFGDPHFITLDDLEYTFNGIGEYILVRTRPGVSVSFELLGRTDVFPGAPDATILTALAFKYGSSITMEISLNESSPFNMSTKLQVSPGVTVDISYMLDVIGDYYNDSGVEIEVEAPGNVVIIVEGTLTLVVSVKNGILDYLLSLPPEYKYQTEGLMGIWNDDQNDDLTPSTSFIPLPVNSTLRDIHYQFGLTWQVGLVDSFFFYPIGEDALNYTNSSYVPKFPDELNYTPDQINLCGDNMACLFDFSQTGNSDIADTSSNQNSEFFVMQADLANFPPVITIVSEGSTTDILLMLGGQHSFEVDVVDEDEGVFLVANSTVSVTASLISDMPLTKRYHVALHTTNTDPFSLSLQATDIKGATSSLHFDITVCACENGECRDGLYSYESSALRYKLQACLCDSGYDGDLCDLDVDGCVLQECYPGVECTDLPPPSIFGECGSCPDGTIEGDTSCVDLNECFGEGGLTHDCNSFGQACINTVGSYMCACMSGYIDQGNACVDINECLLNPCQQVCNNTDGSYMCACFEDWEYLNGTCEPVNGCATDCGFGACAVIAGEDMCVCDGGYTIDPDSNMCVDLDECSIGIASCEDICTNIPKSYLCSCGTGFRLRSDQVTCMDINECEDIFSEPCALDETCINTLGSRRCEMSAAGLSYPILQLLFIAVLLQIIFTLA